MRLLHILRKLHRRVDGQDMVEYALLLGFLAVSAGATLPGVSQDIESIFRRTSKLVFLAAQGDAGPTGTTANFFNPQ